MEHRTYTVHEAARIAGVTVRTLHHYERLGLLAPARRENGYREYGPADLERLQQILLYRECGMGLAAIRDLLDAPGFDAKAALRDHLAVLAARKQQTEVLMETVRRTIAAMEGEEDMQDEERFAGLKQAAIDGNEEAYGREARVRYGDAAIDAANAKLLAMDTAEWSDMNELEAAIIGQLKAAMATGNAAGDEAARLAAMHARWIRMHWGDGAYSPEAHLQLARAYLDDARFTAYYDSRAGEGATRFLVEALESSLGC